ncbi:hypothetical protein Pla108_36950 [Botrimarina colliarenosi]|uniref:Uncharacterized protein n=1 Tax=Botrimarina colliarenosi TaxID=2528001 RepID=A0A5C6A4L8_9BACT|nr:hypothetical protein Pla108_36950 [Botrimarina colliarenosi]
MMHSVLKTKVSLIRIFVASTTLAGSVAWGCPYCNSDVGKEVAAGIFNEDFWFNGALTLLPLPAMLLIVALMRFGAPWNSRSELPPAPTAHRTEAPQSDSTPNSETP